MEGQQVASAHNDGQWAYERSPLRRNGRDLALMCWNLMAARERGGLGRIEAKHQKGHAERASSELSSTSTRCTTARSILRPARSRRRVGLRLVRPAHDRQNRGVARAAQDGERGSRHCVRSHVWRVLPNYTRLTTTHRQRERYREGRVLPHLATRGAGLVLEAAAGPSRHGRAPKERGHSPPRRP